jgi:cell division protein ZapE
VVNAQGSHRIEDRYQASLKDGGLRPDRAQAQAVCIIQDFMTQIEGYNPSPRNLWSLLGLTTLARKKLPFSGLYLYGDVGRGKSMLMDMFFDAVPITKKRRVHFHHFMLEVHDRLHRLQNGVAPDVIPALAQSIASETWLLCFDEFHVSNIADAMILGRLFEALFAAGVLVVCTSNWPPDELYKNGLQRERFLPFIDLIKQKMLVHCLDGKTDHRYEQLRGLPGYFSPLGEATTRQLQDLFLQLTDKTKPKPITLPVQGRTLKITRAAKGVGFFNFNELCVFESGGMAPGADVLGAADYLAIAECLHTVILDRVPQFSDERRNETLRFMTLIDALYEAKVKFFMGAEMPLEKLLPDSMLSFAFERTASRIIEMQSEPYRQKQHLG